MTGSAWLLPDPWHSSALTLLTPAWVSLNKPWHKQPQHNITFIYLREELGNLSEFPLWRNMIRTVSRSHFRPVRKDGGGGKTRKDCQLFFRVDNVTSVVHHGGAADGEFLLLL